MKTLTQHIHHLHGKPHHIRRKIAFGTAAGVAGLIGIIWLVGSLSTGVFALKDNSFADATGAGVTPTSPESTSAATAGLAGAAAAPAVQDSSSGPARIQIVNVTPKPVPKPEQTTIPF
jgi:hypothetical protein